MHPKRLLIPVQSSRLLVFFRAYAGHGIEASGGDRILLELSRNWLREGCDITFVTNEYGEKLCRLHNLNGASFRTLHPPANHFPFLLLYLFGILRGAIDAFIMKTEGRPMIIYSSSDFLPDSLPALILKKRTTSAKWVAGFYFFAPHPLGVASDVAYRGGRAKLSMRNLIYYLSQKLVYRFVVTNADFVLVANELDRRIFARSGYPSKRVKAIYGGVDLQSIAESHSTGLIYDGCFVGRLHPQKGPLELIRIWSLVCETLPHAKLALIGSGPLEGVVRREIRRRGLEGDIDMLGWIEGKRKYEILKSSKIFLHTPVQDTGGMAAAEGMACGLPVVGFDLPGYKYAYPRGMLRAPIGDAGAFARLVLNLLQDEDLYQRKREEALQYSLQWDWEKKATEIMGDILRGVG